MPKHVLAFDLGASGGRAIAGSFDGRRLTLSELHRFANEPVRLAGTLHWDLPRLMHEIYAGITAAARTALTFDSVGVDTWGVDFGLLDDDMQLLELPVHYRDTRHTGEVPSVHAAMPPRVLYAATGIQHMDINTIFQLSYLKNHRPALLSRARHLLFMPDLVNFYLTGVPSCEYTIASTSGLVHAASRTWDSGILDALGLPRALFGALRTPGTPLAPLSPALCGELGCDSMQVLSVAGHDTAAAVAAVPASFAGADKSWAYLSSGTWSLLGVSLTAPLTDARACAANFTNEGGADGDIRFLKNIAGLWIMQETRRQWSREDGAPLSFADIDRLSEQAAPRKRFIDPDHPDFLRPGRMADKICAYCLATGQGEPGGRGEIARIITDSLALKYRQSIEQLESLIGRRIDVLHIVGGGIKDRFLCRAAAGATKKTVVAGPAEATATGNILIQLLSSGEFSSLAQARACVAASFPPSVYEPEDTDAWDAAYDAYLRAAAQPVGPLLP